MEQSLNYSKCESSLAFMLLSVSSIFSQEVQLTKDAAEVKLILSIGISFILALL
jgi:hypothetical protein